MYVHIVGENLYIYFQFVCCVRSLWFCLFVVVTEEARGGSNVHICIVVCWRWHFSPFASEIKIEQFGLYVRIECCLYTINVYKTNLLCILRNGVIPMNIWIKPIWTGITENRHHNKNSGKIFTRTYYTYSYIRIHFMVISDNRNA